MKSASIYRLNDGGYLIHGHRIATTGVRLGSEPFINLQEGAESNEVVRAIRSALSNDDSTRVPHPKDWKQFNAEFLKKTGLKSLKRLLHPYAKLVAVGEKNNEIIFTPTIPAKKPDSGFLFMGEADKVAVLSKASNQEIFSAFELALNRCE